MRCPRVFQEILRCISASVVTQQVFGVLGAGQAQSQASSLQRKGQLLQQQIVSVAWFILRPSSLLATAALMEVGQ